MYFYIVPTSELSNWKCVFNSI